MPARKVGSVEGRRVVADQVQVDDMVAEAPDQAEWVVANCMIGWAVAEDTAGDIVAVAEDIPTRKVEQDTVELGPLEGTVELEEVDTAMERVELDMPVDERGRSVER